MRKYFCDICNNEISGMVKLGSLDFRRGVLELCSSCYPKFKPAKQSIYATYNESYAELDSAYIDSLKEIILAPEEEPTTPSNEEPTNPPNVDPEPVWNDEEEGENT